MTTTDHPTEQSKRLICLFLNAMCTYPGAVRFDDKSVGETTFINMTCAKDDMPKVIGKKGAIANGLRCMVSLIGLKSDVALRLKIEEPTIINGAGSGMPISESPSVQDVLSQLTEAICVHPPKIYVPKDDEEGLAIDVYLDVRDSKAIQMLKEDIADDGTKVSLRPLIYAFGKARSKKIIFNVKPM